MASFLNNLAYKTEENAQNSFEVAENRKPVLSIKFAIKSIVLVLVLASLCAVWINSYVKLTVVTAEVTALSNEQAELQSENNKLQVQLQTHISQGEIRDIAVDEYSMTTLSRSQISYLSMNGCDKAEILTEKSEGFFGSLVKKVLYLFEYLG